MWWRWLCVCVCVCVCVCLCVCVFLHVFICVGLIFLDPVFHEWVWHTVFTRQLPPRRCCFLFGIYFMFGASSCCIFHSEDSIFLMKCGGEGCFEEVFDGRAWREELGIHLPCHTSPSQDKQVGYTKATVFNQFWQPSRCSLLHTLVWWQLSWLCILLRILFLSRVTVMFSQPPSSELASSARYLWPRKACSPPLAWHSWVSSSFFSCNRSCEEIFFKKVQNIVNY